MMAAIDPRTKLGAVRLTVHDLERSTQFYERLLALQPRAVSRSTVAFSTASGELIVELTGAPEAPARDPNQTGLFHFAVLFPSRRDLAVALVRLATARWPLSGASDHLVSEALYLNDPDGNGIELYADRPRESWQFMQNGQVAMDTLPLDIDALVQELELDPPESEGRDRLIPAGTRMGHIHLQVASIPEAEQFYAGLLGFDVMARVRDSALFVSAGGYHHHIGLNTWNSRNGSTPQTESVGLRSFDLWLPDERALDAALSSVSAAGLPLLEAQGGSLVRDPSGNSLVLQRA
jgi:catechol 2,3-dioxygenase